MQHSLARVAIQPTWQEGNQRSEWMQIPLPAWDRTEMRLGSHIFLSAHLPSDLRLALDSLAGRWNVRRTYDPDVRWYRGLSVEQLDLQSFKVILLFLTTGKVRWALKFNQLKLHIRRPQKIPKSISKQILQHDSRYPIQWLYWITQTLHGSVIYWLSDAQCPSL